jgi:3-oxoacyl-[acyl-carrier protein] reductase
MRDAAHQLSLDSLTPETLAMIRYDFTGRTVLVTGSSRGIGAETLEAFARAGANGVIHYFADPDGANRRDAEALADKLRDTGVTLLVADADVRSAESVQALMQRMQAQFGGLDILVNNAGIIRDRTLKKMTLDEWQSVIDTNLTGVFHCVKFAAELLRDGGRIVNIASVAGLVGFPGQTNYSAAKAGIIGMTRVLAKEFARRQITVNAIAPGVVQTAMLGEIRPEVMAEYLKQIPMGRLGKPADIANAVLFLCSEESEYITGQVLPVTGGWV